jgi:small subunit ribosomal protein S20
LDRHASTIKRHRQSLVLRQRNRAAKSAIKTASKNLLESLGKSEAEENLAALNSLLDKAARKNLLHPRTAARRKSKFAKKVTKAATPPEA